MVFYVGLNDTVAASSVHSSTLSLPFDDQSRIKTNEPNIRAMLEQNCRSISDGEYARRSVDFFSSGGRRLSGGMLWTQKCVV